MKTILITGGSRGIGLAIAEKYLETEEYNVVVTGRKEQTLEELSKEVDNKNFHTIAAKADDEEAADNTCKDVNEKFGSLDILVNNAGTNPAGGALMDVDIGAVQKTWDVNLMGPLLWSRAAYKNELSTAIMNICSVGGIAPSQLMGAYNVSKAALIYLTKQLAYELAPEIRVNGVAPAIVKTKLSQLLWENEEFAKNLHLLKKLGEPEDIANAVYYMCSDDAGWVTGEVLTGFGTKALVTKGARVGKYTKALRSMDPIERGAYATQAYGGGHVGAARLAKKGESFKIAATQVAKETGEEIVGTLDWLKTKPFIGRSKLARQNVANKDFINKLEGQTGEMVTWAKSNNNSLDNYPGIRTIEIPDGRVYRLEPSGKTGEGKFSWKSMKAADKATTKRLQSIALDDKTLKRHLVTDSAVQSYTAMNQTVRTKMKSAITRYNKNLPKKDRISLEHVFDVQHYGRMKLKVSKFSGKGADELGNLTVLGAGKNYSTGALAKNIDSGDALIDLIKQDKFIDYTLIILFQVLNMPPRSKCYF